MNLFTLKLAYLLLSLSMILILWIIGFKTIDKTFIDTPKAKSKRIRLIVGTLFWQLYAFGIAQTDILNNFDFPPRFFILLIFPLFVFTGIFIYQNRNNKWIFNIPEHWLIFYQTFRILIESIFVFSVANGILNKEVTIEGYNYDMLYAFTAFLIGYLSYKKLAPKKLFILWNYLGLAVIAFIIFLFISSIYNPQLFGSETMIMPKEAVKYPYILVAGFLMPSAVFIHVLSIVQLIKSNKIAI